MLTVVALDIPDALDRPVAIPSVEGNEPVEVVRQAVPRGESEVVDLVGRLAELLEGDRSVLLVYPSARSADVLPLVRLARLALPTHRVVAVPTALPPLAAGVLVDLVAELTERLDLDGGRAAALVPEIEGQLLVVGWVRSVTRLRRPEPTLVQHLLSWTSPRGFEVMVQPGSSVRRLRPDSTPADTVRAGPVTRAAVLGGAERDRARLVDVLAATGSTSTSTTGPHPYARAWFGTVRAAELVIFPADIDELATALGDRLRVADCSWCGLPGPGGPCAFCGADRVEPAPGEPAPLLVAAGEGPEGDDQAPVSDRPAAHDPPGRSGEPEPVPQVPPAVPLAVSPALPAVTEGLPAVAPAGAAPTDPTHPDPEPAAGAGPATPSTPVSSTAVPSMPVPPASVPSPVRPAPVPATPVRPVPDLHPRSGRRLGLRSRSPGRHALRPQE